MTWFTATVSSAAASVVEGGGLHTVYAIGDSFANPLVERIEPLIDAQWESAPPIDGMPADDWCVRWSGWIRPRFSETYAIATASDDGARLWVGDRCLVDCWAVKQPTTMQVGEIALEAGNAYPLRVEFREGDGQAAMQLSWRSPSQPHEVVPATALFTNEAAALAAAVPAPNWWTVLHRRNFADEAIGPWVNAPNSWSWGDGDGRVQVAQIADRPGRLLHGSGLKWGLGFNVLTDTEIIPGATYRVEAWVRAADAAKPLLAYSVYAESTGPRQRAGTTVVTSTTGQVLSYVWTAPAKLDAVRVLQFETVSHVEGAAGWVDAVTVARMDPAP